MDRDLSGNQSDQLSPPCSHISVQIRKLHNFHQDRASRFDLSDIVSVFKVVIVDFKQGLDQKREAFLLE